MKNNTNEDIPIWIIGLLIVFILIIYVGSFGKIGPNNVLKFPDEFKDSIENARRRHNKLTQLIDKQNGLKTKLDKRFKWTYLFIRLFSVFVWFTFLLFLTFLDQIHNIGDAINYSEACILLLVTFNFITFGSLTNLDKFLNSLKTKTENWVYGKYITLDQKINLNKAEIFSLSKELENDKNAITGKLNTENNAKVTLINNK